MPMLYMSKVFYVKLSTILCMFQAKRAMLDRDTLVWSHQMQVKICSHSCRLNVWSSITRLESQPRDCIELVNSSVQAVINGDSVDSCETLLGMCIRLTWQDRKCTFLSSTTARYTESLRNKANDYATNCTLSVHERNCSRWPAAISPEVVLR